MPRNSTIAGLLNFNISKLLVGGAGPNCVEFGRDLMGNCVDTFR